MKNAYHSIVVSDKRGVMSMFLKKRKINNIYYWSIAESYRENGKVKQRIVINLGTTSSAYTFLKASENYKDFFTKLISFIKDSESCNRLSIKPISLKEANEYVVNNHRHHSKVQGHKFSIAVVDNMNNIRGVAIVGRPVSRELDNGCTLEVTRLCTDGFFNACSFLYSASWRIAKEMGYKKLITYILKSEGGQSLKASGWKCIGEAGGGSWNTPKCGRKRVDKHPLEIKLRWEKS